MRYRQGNTAPVCRANDGTVLGVALFLNADDLADLGFDATYEEAVHYRVKSGQLRIGIGEGVCR